MRRQVIEDNLLSRYFHFTMDRQQLSALEPLKKVLKELRKKLHRQQDGELDEAIKTAEDALRQLNNIPTRINGDRVSFEFYCNDNENYLSDLSVSIKFLDREDWWMPGWNEFQNLILEQIKDKLSAASDLTFVVTGGIVCGSYYCTVYISLED